MSKNRTLLLLIPVLTLALLALMAIFFLDRPDTHTITITVPAKQKETYCFSDTVFQTTENTIHILGSQDLGDSLVLLKAVKVRQKNAYEPTYITPGLEVEMAVEKGATFQIGILSSNSSHTSKEISLSVSGIRLLKS